MSLFLIASCTTMMFGQNIDSRTIITLDTTVCGSYKWMDSVTYTADAVETYLQGDTIYVLSLTVLDNIKDTIVPIVDSANCKLVINGKTYLTSGTYFDTISVAGACDTVRKLQLTLRGGADDTIVASACGYYLFEGDTLRQSRVFDTVLVESGCSENIHVDLTINPVYVDPLVHDTALCSYRWIDTTITDTNIYQRVLRTVSGCDSIVSLQITSFSMHQTDTLNALTRCLQYVWHRDTLSTSGEHTFDTVVDGCTRTYVLPLTIRTTTFDSIDTTACDIFYWSYNDTYYTNSIELKNLHFTGENGCDSAGYLHLTIIPSPTVHIDGQLNIQIGTSTTLTAVSDDSTLVYEWYVGNSTTPTTLDSVTLENVTSNTDVRLVSTATNGCSSTNWVVVTANNLGIDNTVATNVSIYPNPTSHVLNVRSASVISEITLYNAIGQKVMIQTNCGNNTSLNLDNMPNGNYIITTTTADGAQTSHKIIVNK